MSDIYNFFPDLNYFFTAYWKEYQEINIDHINLPDISVYETEDSTSDASCIFRLLFDNNFVGSSYKYIFEKKYASSLPIAYRERLGYISNTINIYSPIVGELTWTDGTSTVESNPLNFVQSDIQVFNLLLEYRQGIIPDLSTLNQDDLISNISKMVYSYLDLMINLNFDPFFNTSVSFSDTTNTLETLYEIYAINEAHRLMKNWIFNIDSGFVIIRPWRQCITITDEILQQRKLRLSYIPYSNMPIYATWDGEAIDQDKLELITDSTSMDGTSFSGYSILFNETLEFILDDIVILDYYTEQPLIINKNNPLYPDEDQDEAGGLPDGYS
jgi:hypothetical protein